MKHGVLTTVLVLWYATAASAQSVSVRYSYPPLPVLDAPGHQVIWTGQMNDFEHFIARHGAPLAEPYFGEGITQADTWLVKASGALLDVVDLSLPSDLAASVGLDGRHVRFTGLSNDGRFVGCAQGRSTNGALSGTTDGFFWEPAANTLIRLLGRDIVPLGTWLCPSSANDAGHVVGNIGVGVAPRGFVLTPTSIQGGYQVGERTRLTAVNQAGDLVGTFEQDGRIVGFVQVGGQPRLIQSQRVYFDGQLAGVTALHVMPAAINSAGAVVGTFVSEESCPNAGVTFMVQGRLYIKRCVRSFYYAGGEFHVIQPPGEGPEPIFRVTGINDKGTIVGWSEVRNHAGDIGIVHLGTPVFLATPTLQIAPVGVTGSVVAIKIEARDPEDYRSLQGQVFEAGRLVGGTSEALSYRKPPPSCIPPIWPATRATCVPSPPIVKRFEVRVSGRPTATITWRY